MEKRTQENPWELATPPGSSKFIIYFAEKDEVEVIMCEVGKTKLWYDSRAIDDAVAMLKTHGDWMLLGSKDEKAEAKEGTLEAWARSTDNPIGGWYGMRKGYRGRFANYVPPLLEALGLVELEHNARNNRVRAI